MNIHAYPDLETLTKEIYSRLKKERIRTWNISKIYIQLTTFDITTEENGFLAITADIHFRRKNRGKCQDTYVLYACACTKHDALHLAETLKAQNRSRSKIHSLTKLIQVPIIFDYHLG